MTRVQLTLVLLGISWSTGILAQTSLTGRVLDGQTGAPLTEAAVQLQYPWGELVKATTTDAEGRFLFEDLERGGYQFLVSFLGYERLDREVTLRDDPLDLGDLGLTPEAISLDPVEVAEKVPTAQMKDDTLQFNAQAFKVMKDASTEELLEKMPTVTVENGTVKAQGDQVQQVLVDGRPFFGNDPSAALKNLPAEVVDKVQVYDAQSDQAQFSGVEDGNTLKTINIVTKPGMRTGQFGKIYTGYGPPDKYQSGGNINVFDGDRRISLIGMSNNINIQNFAFEDILGVLGQTGGRGSRFRGRPPGGRGRGPGGGGSASDFLVNAQGGIASTTAFGVNYSDQWGDKIEVTGSYFFNLTDNLAESDVWRQYFLEDGNGEFYEESSQVTSNNLNHRANLRVEIEIDSMNSLIFRPRATVQRNDGMESVSSSTSLDQDLLNSAENHFTSKLTGWDVDASLLWRHRFQKERRTFSVALQPSFAPQSGDNTLTSLNTFVEPAPLMDTVNQIASLDQRNWGYSINADFTEPIGTNSSLQFTYRGSHQQEESDQATFDFDPASGEYSTPNDLLSNLFSNDYFTHRAGLGYSYRQGRRFTVMVRVYGQTASLLNQQQRPEDLSIDRTFRNLLPFAMVRWTINPQQNLRLFLRSNTDLPSISQLQNVIDNSNPVQLSVGNPELVQSVRHRLFARYQFTDPARSRVLFLMGGGSITQDDVVNSLYLASSRDSIFDQLGVPRGTQLTIPVNLDGAWDMRTFLAYGFPILRQQLNVNFDLGTSLAQQPGLVDGKRNDARTWSVSGGVTLASNVSDRFDLTLSLRPAWNHVTNSLQTNADNTYLTSTSRGKLNWQIWEGFVFRTQVEHQLYAGLSDGFDQQIWIWNLAIGRKVFANELGEVSLAVNDLLNQNQAISRSITEAYIEDNLTNALQQFFMLSFTYNLRHFRTSRSGEAPLKERSPFPRN